MRPLSGASSVVRRSTKAPRRTRSSTPDSSSRRSAERNDARSGEGISSVRAKAF